MARLPNVYLVYANSHCRSIYMYMYYTLNNTQETVDSKQNTEEHLFSE